MRRANDHQSRMSPLARNRARLVVLAVSGAAVLASAACAPVFSELQSAKLVGRNRVEVTPSVSSVSSDGKHAQDEVGLQLATGLTDRVDVRGRYVRVEGVNVVGFGPKVGLVKDKVALSVPVGFAFGGGAHSAKTWAVHPTLLLTAPVSRHAELDASTKALIPFSQGDTLVAFNVGAGFGDLAKWAIRPEVGFLVDPGNSGHFTQFSLGFTYFGGKPKTPEP